MFREQGFHSRHGGHPATENLLQGLGHRRLIIDNQEVQDLVQVVRGAFRPSDCSTKARKSATPAGKIS